MCFSLVSYLACEVFEFGIYAFLVFILQSYIPTLDGILEELRRHVLEHMKAEEEAMKEQGSTTLKKRRKTVTA
jgi:hypothetical protein